MPRDAIRDIFEKEVMYRHGCPKALLVDNGFEFTNRNINEMGEEFAIVITHVPPYHPQANPVKRINRILKTMMRAYLDDVHDEWDKPLGEFILAYNTAAHSSMGHVSPAFMNFGRELKPGRISKKEVEEAPDRCVQDHQQWIERTQWLQNFRNSISQSIRGASNRQAYYYN